MNKGFVKIILVLVIGMAIAYATIPPVRNFFTKIPKEEHVQVAAASTTEFYNNNLKGYFDRFIRKPAVYIGKDLIADKLIVNLREMLEKTAGGKASD